MRMLFATVALLAGITAVASGQTPGPSPVYVSGGWAAAMRYPGDTRGLGSRVPDERSAVQGVALGLGARVTRALGLEISVGLHRAQPIVANPWEYRYLFDEPKDISTTTSDLPVLGLLRIAPGCLTRICIEAVFGGGFSLHSARSTTVAVCTRITSSNQTQTCTAISSPRFESDDRTLSDWEPTLAAGIDVPVRISSSVSLASTFRLLRMERRQYLTNFIHRGPNGDSSIVPSFGVSLTWHSQ